MSQENEHRILPRHVMTANAHLRGWSEMPNPNNDPETEAANQLLKKEIESKRKFANKMFVLGGAAFAATAVTIFAFSAANGGMLPTEAAFSAAGEAIVTGYLVGAGLGTKMHLRELKPEPKRE